MDAGKALWFNFEEEEEEEERAAQKDEVTEVMNQAKGEVGAFFKKKKKWC